MEEDYTRINPPPGFASMHVSAACLPGPPSEGPCWLCAKPIPAGEPFLLMGAEGDECARHITGAWHMDCAELVYASLGSILRAATSQGVPDPISPN